MICLKKVFLLLFLFASGFSPLAALSQDTKSESSLYKSDFRYSFTFRPSGVVKIHQHRELFLDLNFHQRLLLDIELLKAIGVEKVEEVEKKAKALVADAKRLGRDRARARGSEKKQLVTDDWNTSLDKFVSEVGELTTAGEQEVLRDCATAAEFFELGYVGFLKKYSPDVSVRKSEFFDSLESLTDDLRQVEKEVWEKLLSTIDPAKRPEFELTFSEGRLSRTPTLSVLWRSLRSLERGDEIPSGENVKLPVFAVRSGRLVPVGHQARAEAAEMAHMMGMVSKGHSDEELIKKCIRDVIDAEWSIWEKYQGKRKEVMGSPNATQTLKEINRQIAQEAAESREKLFNNLPELTQNRIRRATVVADYQRHGIQLAWFSAKNKALFELPPDEVDLSSLKKHAKEAREILEDRVHKLFKEFILEKLLRHFEPDSANVRWVYRKYPLQIPPLELLGVERGKRER